MHEEMNSTQTTLCYLTKPHSTLTPPDLRFLVRQCFQMYPVHEGNTSSGLCLVRSMWNLQTMFLVAI